MVWLPLSRPCSVLLRIPPYGENTGVLSLTKVFDPRVIRIAAGFAVLFSFSPKVAALIGCMPTATCGGVSLVLYGMISAVGVRNIVETQVDFTKSRNVIIAALILVLSIGINYSAAGAIAFHIGEITISLSGLAVGADRYYPERYPARQGLQVR